MATRRGRDIRIRYDSDTGVERMVVQRTYRDSEDVQITPVTPLLLARAETGVPIDRSRLEPRFSRACVPNEGVDVGRSLMKVVNPYLPGTDDLKNHVREILSFDNGKYSTETVTYTGEGLG